MHFNKGESFEDHAVFRTVTFLRESSLGGMDQTLRFRVDYTGVSEDRQPTLRKDDDRAKAWKFKALIIAAHHQVVVKARGEIRSHYFHLHILQRITNWVRIKPRLIWFRTPFSGNISIFYDLLG